MAQGARRYLQCFSDAHTDDQDEDDDFRVPASGRTAEIRTGRFDIYWIPDFSSSAPVGSDRVFVLLALALPASAEAKFGVRIASGATTGTAFVQVAGVDKVVLTGLSWSTRQEMRFRFDSDGSIQCDGATTGEGVATGDAWSIATDAEVRLGGAIAGGECADGWVSLPYAVEATPGEYFGWRWDDGREWDEPGLIWS